jgi:protocatechuate 3,4-dioxygenase beta subunit
MGSVLLTILLFMLQSASSIEGVVVRSGTSTPVAGARVSIGLATVVSDDSGRFTFTNVLPGRYRLSANHADYVPGQSVDVSISSGDAAKGIVLGMIPKGSISGRVYNKNGDVIAGANVQPLKYAYQDGRRILLTIATAKASGQTNELGEYTLPGLAPGPYIIKADVPQSSSASRETLLPVYFPNTTNASMASVVDLPPGVNFNGVDLRMNDARAVRVSGQVKDGTTGAPALSAAVTLVPRRGTVATGSLKRTQTGEMGSFEFLNMAPGSYDVVTTSAGRLAASISIEIGSDDIENVNLVLQPQLSIKGKVSLENQQNEQGNINLSGIRVELRREPYIPELLILLPNVSADGVFTFDGVTPGEYGLKVSVSGGRTKAYIKSARFGAIDALNPPFHIDGPGEFDVILSPNAGWIDAIVTNNEGKVSSDATIVVVPDPPRRQRFDMYYVAGSDPNGRLHLDGIAPGDYKVFAWDDVPGDAWQDADFIRAYEDRGKPVHIREGGSDNVDLRLIPRLQ